MTETKNVNVVRGGVNRIQTCPVLAVEAIDRVRIAWRPHYRVVLAEDSLGWYFQIEVQRPDIATGDPGMGRGGKGYVTDEMTLSGMVPHHLRTVQGVRPARGARGVPAGRRVHLRPAHRRRGAARSRHPLRLDAGRGGVVRAADRERLRGIAAFANRGDGAWRTSRNSADVLNLVDIKTKPVTFVVAHTDEKNSGAVLEAIVTHIATFDPPTVLMLLDEAETIRSAAMAELADISNDADLRISRAMIVLGEGRPDLLAALDADMAAGSHG